ncbi:MAG: thiamine pyrophosphate-dependent enzyme [Candidatus Latescibacterota bacterium]|nr:thiamine pyrophosphate-dependent enzyme [Candidatus Latescibacterota bacterium]
MTLQNVDGEQALAWGAIEAGVSVVTGYPGSPGTNTFNALQETAKDYGHNTEWCVNERVALDQAAGASQAGKRSLVCLKSVGMNVALDTVMVLNMTGVHAGLVMIMGDDPGAWGSQNEQDTRPISPLCELPMVEVSNPVEGRATVRWAFEFSEKHQTIVIIRLTRSYSVSAAKMEGLTPPAQRISLPPAREPYRFISALATVNDSHTRLHRKLRDIEAEFENSDLNQISGSGRMGVIATGMVYTKFWEAVKGADFSGIQTLKLNTLYPLPSETIANFMKSCDQIIVFEEVDPYLEDAIKVIGYDAGASAKVLGKRTGHVNWEGELFRWHIQKTIAEYIPDFSPSNTYTEENWESERPFRKSHCAGCPYVEIITTFRDVAASLGQNPYLSADPGCVVTAAEYLDAKLCMGSAIGVASGYQAAGVTERTVAICGDSAFYHAGLNGIVQARAAGSNSIVMVLDNGGALTTGGQPTPDGGLYLKDGSGNKVGIREITAVFGADPIWEIGKDDTNEQMRDVFRAALENDTFSVIIVRKPCKHVD